MRDVQSNPTGPGAAEFAPTDEWTAWFHQQRAHVDAAMRDHLADLRADESEHAKTLFDSIEYSTAAGGKRARPILVLESCRLCGGDEALAIPAAIAVECIHAFSLIHDDLPAMDDDDLRRGQPTCHKKFGEATAILTGDSLIVLAFELLTDYTGDAATVAGLVRELAQGAGWSGMIGGQMSDLLGQSQPPDPAVVERIHAKKTARLFESACRLGVMVGNGSEEQLAALGRFGQMMGRAFQVADDLLDVTSSEATLGKGVDKDASLGKQSYPRCVGLEESAALAQQHVALAVEALAGLGREADDLRALAAYAIDRKY